MGIAHLGHFEIRVTDLEKSRRFFTDVMGLIESDADDERVYLRAWQDWDHHTLVLKKDDHLGLEHAGWRVESPDDLNHFAGVFKKQGLDFEWVDAGQELGQGEALRFTTPDGHPMELYSGMEKYAPNEGDALSPLPSHPSKYTGTGMFPRRIDHLNLVSNDVNASQKWINDTLGIHLRYYSEGPDGQMAGSWLSKTNLSHDVAVMINRNGTGGKLHHVAYYIDSGEELLRAAKILAENGVKIEWGPGNHGTSGATFLYFFEPSGNRVEVWTGGMLIFDPDWEPIRWAPDDMQGAFERWNSPMPEGFFTNVT